MFSLKVLKKLNILHKVKRMSKVIVVTWSLWHRTGQGPGPRSQQPLQRWCVMVTGHHWPRHAWCQCEKQKHNKRIKILIKIKLNARPHAWLLIWRKALSTECGLAAGVCMTPWAIAGPAQWGLCSDPGLSALWESRSPSQFIHSKIQMIIKVLNHHCWCPF